MNLPDRNAPRPWRWNTLSTRILLGLLVGLAAGAALSGRPPVRLDPLLAITAPIGQLWLDALTMTVVPLVFGLLVTGVGSATSSAAAGGVAMRAIVWFAILLVAACALSGGLTTALLAWSPVPAAGQGLWGGEPPSLGGAGAWFSGIIPANPIKAAAETRMVPLVVFALFFGFAASRIETRLRTVVMTFFEAVVATMLVIVRGCCWPAP